jgi:uncharacterized protein
MLIGIMADTHNKVPASLHRAFAGVDLILHAGDFMTQDIRDEIAIIAPLRFVRGNNDYCLPPSYPEHDIVAVDGLTVALTHGHCFPLGKIGLYKMIEHFRPHSPDLIVYGHSHRYSDDVVDRVRLFNPGSAGMRSMDGPPTAAILSLSGKGFDIERVEL